MKTVVLNEHYNNGEYTVTYKYWIEGDCACTAQKIKRTFKSSPSQEELQKAINK